MSVLFCSSWLIGLRFQYVRILKPHSYHSTADTVAAAVWCVRGFIDTSLVVLGRPHYTILHIFSWQRSVHHWREGCIASDHDEWPACRTICGWDFTTGAGVPVHGQARRGLSGRLETRQRYGKCGPLSQSETVAQWIARSRFPSVGRLGISEIEKVREEVRARERVKVGMRERESWKSVTETQRQTESSGLNLCDIQHWSSLLCHLWFQHRRRSLEACLFNVSGLKLLPSHFRSFRTPTISWSISRSTAAKLNFEPSSHVTSHFSSRDSSRIFHRHSSISLKNTWWTRDGRISASAATHSWFRKWIREFPSETLSKNLTKNSISARCHGGSWASRVAYSFDAVSCSNNLSSLLACENFAYTFVFHD